jgi:hypothetical protein
MKFAGKQPYRNIKGEGNEAVKFLKQYLFSLAFHHDI